MNFSSFNTYSQAWTEHEDGHTCNEETWIFQLWRHVLVCLFIRTKSAKRQNFGIVGRAYLILLVSGPMGFSDASGDRLDFGVDELDRWAHESQLVGPDLG